MTSWGDAAFDAYLPAEMVLGHADIAVIVTDRLSNLLYLNEFAARLFRVSGDVTRLAGCPVESLGLFADDGVRRSGDLAGQVLRGRPWEGTVESTRGDGSRTLIRVQAVPPMKIAPIQAKTSRQISDGMPICDRPSTA